MRSPAIIVSRMWREYERILTMMMPPPTLLLHWNDSSRPSSFATQSVTTTSSSVQAGEHAQLNPGFDTAPTKISARMLSYVVLAAGGEGAEFSPHFRSPPSAEHCYERVNQGHVRK